MQQEPNLCQKSVTSLLIKNLREDDEAEEGGVMYATEGV